MCKYTIKPREKVKRLSPTAKVTRELYLKSGNICAFPGCHNVMIDEDGTFIGEVCHIEAAETGGERFNENMTNEQRREFSNLILMCHKHHKKTNDVNKYTVTKLKKMKKKHEEKFSGIIQQMRESIVDYGKIDEYKDSKVCNRLTDVLGYGNTVEENTENSKLLNKLLEKLVDLPVETRGLLAIMVERSFKDRYENCIIPLSEIQSATFKDESFIIEHLDILNRRCIASMAEVEDDGIPYSYLYKDDSGWNIWNDMREYCKKTDVDLNDLIVEGDFSLFD